MAKKIPKIPIPRAKTKLSAWDKFYAGIAGLSPFTGRAALYQSMDPWTPSGKTAQAAHRANLLKKYGKWGSRAGRWSGLTNPWTAIPFALGYGAKHAVGSALEGYKNQDVEDTGMFFDNRGISAAGNERLLQERLAREELMFARNAARQNQRDGGLAGLL